MGSFVLRGTVAAPPETVFAVLSDPARTSALFSGASADVPLAPGPVKAGARLRRSRTVAGQTVGGEATVEVHRPPKELAIVGEARGVRVEQRWRLTPDGAGTAVEYECSVRASGFASLFEGKILDAVRAADADHLDRLRRAAETR